MRSSGLEEEQHEQGEAGRSGRHGCRDRRWSWGVSKKLDASSPKLLSAAASGKHYPDATLVVTANGLTTTYKLKEVFVTAVKQSDDGSTDANPLEKVSLTFGSFEVATG